MKYLHTMVRVTDIDESLDFYCNKLGLVELRRHESEKGRFTLVFLAAPGDEDAQVELTYNWDPETGLSPRPIPGMMGGQYILTGLAHTKYSKVAYDSESNQLGCEMRSRKLAALASTLKPPLIHGDSTGDLLVVGINGDESVRRLKGDDQHAMVFVRPEI